MRHTLAFAACGAGLSLMIEHARSEEDNSLKEMEDAVTFADFLSSAKMLGKGDYGYVLELDGTRVIKVIDLTLGSPGLSMEYKELKFMKEVSMQQRASQVQTPDGFGCVPPVLSKVHRVPGGNRDRFLFFVMPKLHALDKTWSCAGIAHVMTIADCLLSAGLLHNDMHAGNIMQLHGKPILVDMGLMTHDDLRLSEPLRTIVMYAQCAALIDCCTCYNDDVCTTELRSVWELRNTTEGIFSQMGIVPWNRDVESQERYIARVAQQVADKFHEHDVAVQIQLILAHLSLHFSWSPTVANLLKQPEICKIGAPIGDAMYAIRNPDDFGYTSRDSLLQDLKSGRVNLPA